MRNTLRGAFFALVVTLPLTAQTPAAGGPDRVTLANGDVLHGTVKSMAGGKLLFAQPALADLTIPLDKITDLQTAQPVAVKLDDGSIVQRRITGIRDGQLQLADGPGVALARLAAINPPPVEWTGSLTVGAAYLTGNTERRAIHSDFNAERRSDDDRISARGNWNYAEDKDQVTKDWELSERKASGNLKYDYFVSQKAYLFATTGAETDTLANLKLRFTAGAGVGYQFVEEPDFKFGVEVGASYVMEDYRGTAQLNEFVAARVAYKLEKRLADWLKFEQLVELFPSLEETEDVFVKTDSRLVANLTESMIAQFKVTWDWDNTPAAGRDRDDLGAFLTVGWSF
jgi:putative salt-induced outer membrane protein YdiY